MMLAIRCLFVIALSLGVGTVQLMAQTAASAEDLFQSKVLPILKTNCVACHNEQTPTSGLVLTSRESLLAGGNRGPAIVPGQAAESLLIRAIQQSGGLKMPPGIQLPSDVVAALTEWVERGAEWTTPLEPQPTAAARKGADHWAFRPVKRPPVPQVQRSARVRNAIDNYILAGLEEKGIEPSPEADRRTLIRRVTLDLTGLLPAPEEIDQFVHDERPDAYGRVVDRLLASPHYGERWARHWLDVARYADTNGYVRDNPRQMWKYRDWVIQALNRDLPFDQFVTEQIAGDLLPNATSDQIVATGFHRNTLINLEGGVDFEQYRVEAVIDRVSTTGRVFLGLTLGCARCHDHKYDPVSQREFYQFYAFFNSIDELSGELSDEEGRSRSFDPILEFGTPVQNTQRDAVREQVARLKSDLDEYEKGLPEKFRDWEKVISAEERSKLTEQTVAALRTDPEQRTETQKRLVQRLTRRLDPGYRQRQEGVKALEKLTPEIPYTLVMRDLPQPRKTQVLIGGDFTSKGIEVQHGTPAILPPLEKQGPYATRLDLARWLVDPRNPLPVRVTVNRMWQHYFGRGLVETEDDFGLRSAPPDNPELLDWLASEFVARGWSMKAMHRLIVTSATYRQASMHRDEIEKGLDPGNRLLSRQSRLRLEAEIVRDVALSASGMLEPTIGGPSVFPPQPELAGAAPQSGPWVTDKGPNRYRRGIYTTYRRGSPHPVFMAFDQPDAAESCTRRQRSNTPLQALSLLNDEAFLEFAQGLSKRILKEPALDQRQRILLAFTLCVGRPPLSDEETEIEQFLARQLDRFQTHTDEAVAIAGASAGANPALSAAWTSVARILLNLDEFITRE